MSEELQNEGFTIEAASDDITEAAPVEASENPKGPELATETQHEVTAEPTEAEKEAKRQAAFNKQYGEKKRLERERDEARAEIAKMQQVQQPTNAPEVGDFPNEFDYDTTEDFESAKTRFVTNVRANEQYAQSQQHTYNTQQAENNRVAAEQQEKLNANLVSYTASAKKNGISDQELQTAANSVYEYGITPDLTHAILADPDGPLLTKYLAANPQEVQNLVSMNPYAAGAHMINLKAKAATLKPKTSSTPSPTTDISGGGGDVTRDSPLIKGATFE
jgi:hypothetical protein